MLKTWLGTAALTVAILLSSGSTADAGKYGSGRSGSGFSSSSSGRSYSSGSKPSYSAPASKPSYSAPKPSIPAGRSYSSGGSTPAPKYSSGSPAPKATPAPSSSGGKYSSGGSTPAPIPKGKSYSSGGTSNPGSPATGPPKSKNNLDAGGAQAQQKLDSKASYLQSKAPAATYKDPKTGTEKKFSEADKKHVETIRTTVTHERYITRSTRVETFYGPTYIHRPTVYYSDPFGPFFYLWLLDRSLDDRARWAYHHRQQMDDARYRDMVAKDAALEARIRQLEAEKLQRDPNYVPAAMKDQPDLMYNDAYVNAAYNPTPAVYTQPPPRAPGSGPSAGTVLMWFLIIIVVIVVVSFVVWFIFIRETD
jgi:hypothetical protein